MPTRVRWDPAKHPRGPLGRFIDVSGGSPFKTSDASMYSDQRLMLYGKGGQAERLRLRQEYHSGSLVRGTALSALPEEHRRVANDYLSASWINETARDGPETLRRRGVHGIPGVRNAMDYAHVMDEVVEANRINEDMNLYRAVAGPTNGGPMRDAKPGDQLVDFGFSSTSIDPDVTRDFGDDVLEIRVPAGTSVAPLSTLNDDFWPQLEMVIGRGAVFEIRAIRDLDGGSLFGDPPRHIIAELVGYVDRD